jgi:hypothetical protein
MAMMNGEYEAAGKLTEKADKLDGLLDEETVGHDPEDFMKASNSSSSIM